MEERESSVNVEREMRILSAAERLILHYGYDKTTVSDIAREAGISKGAVYLHFTGKDALFDALILRTVQAYTFDWMARIKADPTGGTLGGIYRNILYSMRDSPLLMALFTRDVRVLGAYARRETALFRNKRDIKILVVEQMQAVGAVRQGLPPTIIAHMMNMLAYGLISMHEVMDEEDIPPLEDVIDGIGWMLDAAFTPENPNSEAGKIIIQKLVDAIQSAQNAANAETSDEEA